MQTNSKPSKPKAQNPNKHFGFVRQLTKTDIFIVTTMKKHIWQFILPKDIFDDSFTEKNMDFMLITLFLLEMQTRFLFFFLHKIKTSKQARFIL